MADSREQLKRKNYFDLKRDEFMAMDEYLQSPISEIDLRNVSKAGGGIMNIDEIIRPIGMAAGGPIPSEPETPVPHRGSRLSKSEYPKNFKGSFFGGGADLSTYDDFQDPETLGPGRSPTILERLMNKQGVGFDPKGVVKDPEEFNVSMMDIDEMTQPVGLMEDADNLKILGMKLILQEAADSLDEFDRIDKLSPSEIIIEFENLIGKKGA